jgi:hypothetical protein
LDRHVHREASPAPARDREEDMKRIFVALVALAAACGGEKERPIQYGAPAAPTTEQQGAATTAEATLQGTFTFAGSTQPAAGAPGLADQLVAQLGAYQLEKAMPTTSSAKLAASAASRAIDTGGIDPQCVDTSVPNQVTWTGCVVEQTTTDSFGDTTTVRVTVDGTLSYTPATGVTTWNIDEHMAMTQTSTDGTMTMNVAAHLEGTITVTASRISGSTLSTVDMSGSYGAIPLNAGLRTTLAVDLGYQAEPFCVTSGTLALEQRWTQRPVGATAASAPDQGWQFEWTGCNQLTVRYGRS